MSHLGSSCRKRVVFGCPLSTDVTTRSLRPSDLLRRFLRSPFLRGSRDYPHHRPSPLTLQTTTVVVPHVVFPLCIRRRGWTRRSRDSGPKVKTWSPLRPLWKEVSSTSFLCLFGPKTGFIIICDCDIYITRDPVRRWCV